MDINDQRTIMLFLSALTILSASGVIVAKRPLNSALWLIATLCLIAGHYAFMGSVLMALLQILIYAGAIMVLVVFILMLLGQYNAERETNVSIVGAIAAVLSGGLLGILVFMTIVWSATAPVVSNIASEIKSKNEVSVFGNKLFGDYMYVCNLIGVLLFIALIGCVLLALEPKRRLALGRGLKAMHSDMEGR